MMHYEAGDSEFLSKNSLFYWKEWMRVDYRINFEHYKHNFSLPCAIMTNIQQTESDYLKIILMIFGNPDKDYSVNLLSNLLNIPESKISEALAYWIQTGLLLPSGEKAASPQPSVHLVSPPAPEKAAVTSYQDSELQFLISGMEGILERTVTSTDIKTITYIYEYYRMPADVLLMAIQYCVKKGKKDIRYIEKVCVGWYDAGIITHTKAEEFLKKSSEKAKQYDTVKRMFGIENRNLIASEEKFIDKWFEEFHFTADVIQLAFERTIKNTGKVAFAYTGKILSNWHQQGLRSVAEIEEKDGIRKPAAVSDGQKSYDLDALDEYWNKVPRLD